MKNLELNVKKIQLPNGFFCAIAYLKGFIDGDTIQQFEEEMNVLFDDGVRHLVLNLQNIKYINSKGIGTLVKILNKYDEVDGDIKLVKVHQRIIELFNIVGITPFFELYQENNEALEALPFNINMQSFSEETSQMELIESEEVAKVSPTTSYELLDTIGSIHAQDGSNIEKTDPQGIDLEADFFFDPSDPASTSNPPTLIMVSSKNHFHLEKGEISIGRRSNNDIIVPHNDLLASGNHAIIRRENERYKLENLDSSNGTYINGRLIREQFLADQDIILIGKTNFVFLEGDFFSSASQVQIFDQFSFVQPYQELEKSLAEIEERIRELRILWRLERSLTNAKNSHEVIDIFFQSLLEEDFFVQKALQIAYIHYDQTVQQYRIRKRRYAQEIDVPKNILTKALHSLNNDEEVKCLLLSPNNNQKSSMVIPIVSPDQIWGFLYFELCELQCISSQNLQIISAISQLLLKKLEQVTCLYHKLDIEKTSKLHQRTFQSGYFGYGQTPNKIMGYGMSIPGNSLEGEYYNTFWNDPYLNIFIGNIHDRGAKTAFVTTTINAFLAGFLSSAAHTRPRDIAKKLDRFLSESFANIFATMVILQWNSESGELKLVNMGHDNPLLCSFSNNTWLFNEIQTSIGVPIGINKNIKRPIPEEKLIQLEKNEFLMLYTDGIGKITDDCDVEFTLKMIKDSIKRIDRATSPKDIAAYLPKKNQVLVTTANISVRQEKTQQLTTGFNDFVESDAEILPKETKPGVENYYSYHEVIAILRVTPDHLQLLVENGNLDCLVIGDEKKFLRVQIDSMKR